MGNIGQQRSALSVILLTLVTLGIYGLYWQYKVFQEMKDHSGTGIGGGLGLLIAIFLSIVNCFLMPSEVAGLYRTQGQEPPVSGTTGLWVLLPLVGWFVWLVKVQGALNAYWASVSGPSAPAGQAI